MDSVIESDLVGDMLTKLVSIILLILLTLPLCGCATDSYIYAPVTDASGIEPIPKNGIHRVVSGESLYEIAWRYGLDYRSLVQWNHFSPTYHVRVGQIIYLRQQRSLVMKATKPAMQKVKKISSEHEPTGPISQWVWPAKGNVITVFSASSRGVNIAGEKGEAIVAAAGGKVVYAGNGLRAYGALILIKHNELFLSAYAHNNVLYVQEGDWVNKGQKIAGMGNSGSRKVMLHFEIRRAGKPVNPYFYLPLNVRQ